LDEEVIIMDNPIWRAVKSWFFGKDETKDKQSNNAPKEKLSFFHWILIIACIGLAAMILHNYFSIKQEVSSTLSPSLAEEEQQEVFGSASSSPKSMDEYEEFYENQLKDILSTIVGVGDVSIMVNLESTEKVVVEKNIRTQQSQTNEKDREGGSRNIEDHMKDEQVVIKRNGDGEEPIILMTEKPKVRGVLVVAEGANNIQVKTWIAEAVQRVLDIPLHKISVLPKKS
jgi:stage III sporulation protein AG